MGLNLTKGQFIIYVCVSINQKKSQRDMISLAFDWF